MRLRKILYVAPGASDLAEQVLVMGGRAFNQNRTTVVKDIHLLTKAKRASDSPGGTGGCVARRKSRAAMITWP